jgi:hypothetical protein
LGLVCIEILRPVVDLLHCSGETFCWNA